MWQDNRCLDFPRPRARLELSRNSNSPTCSSCGSCGSYGSCGSCGSCSSCLTCGSCRSCHRRSYSNKGRCAPQVFPAGDPNGSYFSPPFGVCLLFPAPKHALEVKKSPSLDVKNFCNRKTMLRRKLSLPGKVVPLWTSLIQIAPGGVQKPVPYLSLDLQ